MANMFRCGYKKISVQSVSSHNGFITIDWTQGKDNIKYTSICHISRIDLQESRGHDAGDLFEVDGVDVGEVAFKQIKNLILNN